MPKTAHRLTAKKIENLKRPGLHADGAGLYLKVSPTGAKSWVYGFMISRRARYLGLGSAGAVSLKAARRAASNARRLCEDGTDPIEARNIAQRAAQLAEARSLTFRACAEEDVIEDMLPSA
jgi:hypothetical protein